MKKFLLTFLISFACTSANAATTYYTRVNGGTADQCVGTTNADYPGTGIAQACAFNHPSWAIGTGNVAGKMVGGDTLIIDDNSGTAQYMVGYGMPNTSGASLFFPYDVSATLRALPSGTDIAHPTRVLGSAYATGCATKPQLWGTQSMGTSTLGFFNLSGKNYIDIECIEITDHSNCGFRVGANQCGENFNGSAVGTYARGPAIYSLGGSNFTFKNLDIHGLAGTGIHMGGINTITMSHVDLFGNHGTGWDGDVGETGGAVTSNPSYNSGTMLIDHVRTRFAGCTEAYPRSGSYTAADYTDCVDAPNGPYAADGWGFYFTGGDWVITDSEWSHNTSDGLDLLYGSNTLNLSIDRCLFEGNNGNQLKFTGKNVNVTNSIIIANCNYLLLKGKTTTGTSQTCRANGTPVSATPVLASNWKFTNVTGFSATGSGGSAFLEIIDRNGTCNGTESYAYKNDTFVSNVSATNWPPYYNGLSGACSTPFAAATTDHSLVYAFTTNPAGTGNVFTAPAWAGTVSATADSNVTAIYPSSNVGGGATTTYWNTPKDYNNFPQNASIDKGAIQFGSSAQLAQAGQACTATSDCASGTCAAGVCTGSCTANAGACATGATCCSSYCNGSLQCATAPTCGDAVIQPGETCDTTNLNGSNCILNGFTGGALACASNCLSFNTASCTNTLVFPLSPILDSFTRANSTGISNASWTNLAGSFNISSNAAIPVSVSGALNKYYWSASTFGADEEVYATISNKGADSDNLKVYLRADIISNNAYLLTADTGAGTLRVSRVDAGTGTTLGADIVQALSSGDSIGMSMVGSTITVYYKAAAGSWVSKGTRTDTTYTAGGNLEMGSNPGGATPDIKFTNFGGGTINPVTCGNNLKETGEICDGTDLGGQSCVSQGFASGTLACVSHCNSFDTTSCVSASVCGNNTKESGEVCDGTDLNSATCTSLGFSSGTVSCNSNCLTFNTSLCVASSNGFRGGVTVK